MKVDRMANNKMKKMKKISISSNSSNSSSSKINMSGLRVECIVRQINDYGDVNVDIEVRKNLHINVKLKKRRS